MTEAQKKDLEKFNLLFNSISHNYDMREGFNMCVDGDAEVAQYQESLEYNALTANLPIRFKIDTIDRDSNDRMYDFDDGGMDVRYEHWENNTEESDYEDLGDFQEYEEHEADPNHRKRRIF